MTRRHSAALSSAVQTIPTARKPLQLVQPDVLARFRAMNPRLGVPVRVEDFEPDTREADALTDRRVDDWQERDA